MTIKDLHDVGDDREQASHAHECDAFARLRWEKETCEARGRRYQNEDGYRHRASRK